MEQVTANGHHYHEHGVFVQKREGHFLPQKIIVHLVEQALAVAPVVVKFNYFKVGHFIMALYVKLSPVNKSPCPSVFFSFDTT